MKMVYPTVPEFFYSFNVVCIRDILACPACSVVLNILKIFTHGDMGKAVAPVAQILETNNVKLIQNGRIVHFPKYLIWNIRLRNRDISTSF